LAIEGEEVVITDAGKPIIKLIAVDQQENEPARTDWLESLRELRELTSALKGGKSYSDSSALVKLYTKKIDSAVFEQFASSSKVRP
jgi:antitoxin (DNA-binding transcriptional repressor) of toxin-antitoxin stability system